MTTPGYPQGHALLVGVSKYQRISSLPDAILNDVKDVAATLSSPTYCGYAQENVVSLLNADATRNAVLEGLSDLAARAAEDDTVCIYFSGHGTVFTSLPVPVVRHCSEVQSSGMALCVTDETVFWTMGRPSSSASREGESLLLVLQCP